MSYYKDRDYRRSERPQDDRYGTSGRSRDGYGSSERSRDDYNGSSSRSRDNDYGRQGGSYGNEKYSSNTSREYGSYDDILTKEEILRIISPFDLDMNVVLADSYRVRFRGGKEPTCEEVLGLLVMRGSRVQNVRRERREQRLAEYKPPVPNSRKDKKKKTRKPETTESGDASMPKFTPTRLVKLKRVWKEENSGQPRASGGLMCQIRELKIKKEPADAEHMDLEAILKREPRDDLEDALAVEREPQGGGYSELKGQR